MFPVKLREAIRLAYEGRRRDARSYSLAAVGMRGDCVVRSTNLLSYGKELRAHAEARCLSKMCMGGIIFVARVRKDGSIGNSRPCGGCRLLAKFKFCKIIYTISDSEWGTYG